MLCQPAAHLSWSYPCVSMCLKYHQYCTCCVNLQHTCHGAIPVSVCVLSVINIAVALSTYSTPVIEVSLSVCVLRVISSVHTVNLTHTCHGGILLSMCLKCYQWCIRCQSLFRSCVSRGGRPGLSVLTSLLVSVDINLYWTMLWHWSQLVPNMSTDIWGHWATLPT